MKLRLKTVSSLLIVIGLVVASTFAVASVFGQGGPNGPRTNNMLIHIYLNPDAENEALEAGELDINDWPLSKYWVDTWTVDPEITLKAYCALDDFELDLNNQRWPTGVTMPRVYDPFSDTYKHYYDDGGTPGIVDTWDDVACEFRKAIAHLTDKDAMISDVVKGYGFKKETIFPTPALAGYTNYQDLESKGLIYGYDPYEANAKLDAAGFVQGSTSNPYYPASPEGWEAMYLREDPQYGGDLQPLEFYIRLDDPQRTAAGTMICDELRKAGIPVNAYIVEKSACYENVMVLYDFHLYTGNWGDDFGVLPFPWEWLYTLYHSSGYWGGSEITYFDGIGWSRNYPGFASDEFDSCVEMLRYAATPWEIIDATLWAQEIFAQYVPTIPLWSSAAFKAHRTGWDGVINTDGYGMDNYWSFLTMRKSGDNTIDWGFKSNLEGLNPITSQWKWDWKVLGLVYDSLVGLNPHNRAEVYGWLAAGWEIGTWEGGTTITFALRDDVLWHDGTVFTPMDVAFSMIFTRDCGPGVAWNYASVMDINHVAISPASYEPIHWDIESDPSLGAYDVKVYFDVESDLVLWWIGFLPIISKNVWMAANEYYGWGWPVSGWDRMGVRDYHPWQHDIYDATTQSMGADGIYDLCQDGTGAWIYDSMGVPAAIQASTWVLLTANVDFYKSQTEISNYLVDTLHRIGNVNYPGSYFEPDYTYIDQEIDAYDLALIYRAYGTDASFSWGTNWGEYNPDADLNNDGEVDGSDLCMAGANYGLAADPPLPPSTSAPTIICVDPEFSEAQPGETFDVNLTISSVNNLFAWEVMLDWDHSALDVISTTEGPFLKEQLAGPTFFVNYRNNTKGYLKLSVTGTGKGAQGAYGNGTLATVTFQVKTGGASVLRPSNTMLTDPFIPHPPWYNPFITHTAEEGFFGAEDVAVTYVKPSKTFVGVGQPASIYVDITNQGLYTEAFSVTTHANETIIQNKVVSLASQSSTTVTFTWDTAGFDLGNYTISASAAPLPNEMDTGDNYCSNGIAQVTIAGDLDGDRDVDMADLSWIARAWGTTPLWPHGTGWYQWNPNCDINNDKEVDAYDLSIAAYNYGTGC